MTRLAQGPRLYAFNPVHELLTVDRPDSRVRSCRSCTALGHRSLLAGCWVLVLVLGAVCGCWVRVLVLVLLLLLVLVGC